jgi:hypothetical protein
MINQLTIAPDQSAMRSMAFTSLANREPLIALGNPIYLTPSS